MPLGIRHLSCDAFSVVSSVGAAGGMTLRVAFSSSGMQPVCF